MNANTIFLIIQLLLFCLLISCLIVGDTYLTYMIFNSNSYTCESFLDAATTVAATTVAATTVAATTVAATTVPITTAPSTTAPAPAPPAPLTKLTSQYSVCYNLSDTQLGFARFKIIVFWVLFVCITGGTMYMLAKWYNDNQIVFGIAIAITLGMSIMIIVGGAFMTQYGFTGGNKTCMLPNTQTKSTEYCYNLNDIEIGFTKIAVIFGWLYSFIAIITIGLFLWEANLG